jgi:hypothetical protein
MKPGSLIRAYNTWSTQEDNLLDQMYETFVNKCAVIHSRSITAIIHRLENYQHPVKFREPSVKSVETQTD